MGMGDLEATKEFDLPLHLQLAMRKAEIAAKEMTWEQLEVALLNLYHQRLLEIQAIKDMLQSEEIELEFDIPTDIELAQLALSMMSHEELFGEDDEDDAMPF